MQMPEPLSTLSRPKPTAPAQRASRWALLGAVVLLSGAATALHFHTAWAGADNVDPAEIAQRATAIRALGPLHLTGIAGAALPTFLTASGLSPGDEAMLVTDVLAGRTRAVQIGIFDSDAEDGDVAEIRSGGMSQTVRLTKKPIMLAIPVGPDDTVTITGLIDGGGGGVTVGLVLPTGPVALPPLSVGQTVRIAVAPP